MSIINIDRKIKVTQITNDLTKLYFIFKDKIKFKTEKVKEKLLGNFNQQKLILILKCIINKYGI